MTSPARAELIREAWHRIADYALTLFFDKQRALVRAMLPSYPPLLPYDAAPALNVGIEVVDFLLEFSELPPWHWRIRCEDVVLETGRASGRGLR